jgi:hypothetical protein
MSRRFRRRGGQAFAEHFVMRGDRIGVSLDKVFLISAENLPYHRA